ncbi:hypothetical protein [Spirillospora sp. NPDC047279]|uniref:hypothetical protein n=1 Tax=Spirillospora sp. NPDC047279 TaxID=3155478 RepID=UPI0033F9CCAD
MDLNELVTSLENETAPIFRQMEIAEEEIKSAMERHGECPPEWDEGGRLTKEPGPIWKSFKLLMTAHFPRPMPELLYRGYVSELLDRRVKGEDTRPATAAEMVFALSEVSLAVPLNSAGAGLYLKLMYQCCPDLIRDVLDEIGRDVQDYERIHGQEMAEIEERLRKKMLQKWRTL